MNRIATIFLVTLLAACGPSDSDVRMIKAQAIMEEKALKEAERTFHKESEALAKAKAEFVVAQDRLARAHEFKFGRSVAAREDQIREATMYLEEVRVFIQKQELVAANAERNYYDHRDSAPMGAAAQ